MGKIVFLPGKGVIFYDSISIQVNEKKVGYIFFNQLLETLKGREEYEKFAVTAEVKEGENIIRCEHKNVYSKALILEVKDKEKYFLKFKLNFMAAIVAAILYFICTTLLFIPFNFYIALFLSAILGVFYFSIIWNLIAVKFGKIIIEKVE